MTTDEESCRDARVASGRCGLTTMRPGTELESCHFVTFSRPSIQYWIQSNSS